MEASTYFFNISTYFIVLHFLNLIFQHLKILSSEFAHIYLHVNPTAFHKTLQTAFIDHLSQSQSICSPSWKPLPFYSFFFNLSSCIPQMNRMLLPPQSSTYFKKVRSQCQSKLYSKLTSLEHVQNTFLHLSIENHYLLVKKYNRIERIRSFLPFIYVCNTLILVINNYIISKSS